MMQKILGLVLALSLLGLSLSGCSTTRALIGGNIREPYAGTKLNSFILHSPDSSRLERWGAILDFPFSLTIDLGVLLFMQASNAEQLITVEYE